MKKVITICLTVGMFLAISGMAQAGITSNPSYVASSNLVLGSLTAKGYQLAQEFQFNLVYQPGIADGDIDALNNYNVSTSHLNYADYDCYYLTVNSAGGLPIGIWDFNNNIQYYAPDSGQPWAKWTLNYYDDDMFHTILAGDIVSGSGDSFLRVRPPQSYRSFLWDGLANDVEVFEGAIVYSEVLGYSYSGTLGLGTTLTPMLDSSTIVPAPAAILLGGIGVTLVGWLRRRRTL